MTKFDGQYKTGIDTEIENKISEHCSTFKIEQLDAVRLFPVLARRQWLKRFLAHSELFQKTIDIPGDIADFGVFRGSSLMTWANLLEIHCIGDRTKIVYGFDNWNGFPELTIEDGENKNEIEKFVGGFSPKQYYEELNKAIDIFDNDRFIPWKSRIKLVEGNIEETVIDFVKENPGVRFSLIHLDCDLYKPTKVVLENLWSRLCRGGVIIFDEYSIKEWAGETAAVDEYFKDIKNATVKKFSWTNSPAGYIIKE